MFCHMCVTFSDIGVDRWFNSTQLNNILFDQSYNIAIIFTFTNVEMVRRLPLRHTRGQDYVFRACLGAQLTICAQK